MTGVRCRCGHQRSYHEVTRRLCHGSTVCGCAGYQARDVATAHEEFEQVMNSGAPIVDNASDRLYPTGELEGDRCPGCGDRIPGDVDRCDECRHEDERTAVHRAMRMDRYDPSPAPVERRIS